MLFMAIALLAQQDRLPVAPGTCAAAASRFGPIAAGARVRLEEDAKRSASGGTPDFDDDKRGRLLALLEQDEGSLALITKKFGTVTPSETDRAKIAEMGGGDVAKYVRRCAGRED